MSLGYLRVAIDLNERIIELNEGVSSKPCGITGGFTLFRMNIQGAMRVSYRSIGNMSNDIGWRLQYVIKLGSCSWAKFPWGQFLLFVRAPEVRRFFSFATSISFYPLGRADKVSPCVIVRWGHADWLAHSDRVWFNIITPEAPIRYAPVIMKVMHVGVPHWAVALGCETSWRRCPDPLKHLLKQLPRFFRDSGKPRNPLLGFCSVLLTQNVWYSMAGPNPNLHLFLVRFVFFHFLGCEVEEEYVVPVASGYIAIVVPSGKHTKNYGKSPFLWVNPLFQWPFPIAMFVCQRVGVGSQLVTMVDGSGGVKPQDWLISWTGPRMRSLGTRLWSLIVGQSSISSISSTSSISSISWANIEWNYWMGFYASLSNMLGLSQFMNEIRSERKDHLPKPKRIVEMVKKYRYPKSHLLPSHKSWIYHISYNSDPTKG